MSVEKYGWAIQKNLFAQTNQDSTFFHNSDNSKIFNITLTYFSFLNFLTINHKSRIQQEVFIHVILFALQFYIQFSSFSLVQWNFKIQFLSSIKSSFQAARDSFYLLLDSDILENKVDHFHKRQRRLWNLGFVKCSTRKGTLTAMARV